MRATVLHAARDIRLDDVPTPQILADTDAIVRVVAACICGSDLWPYRGVNEVTEPLRIGHDFVGVVEQVGATVTNVTPGDFVIAPFTFSDNTCKLCERGVHTSCVNGGFWATPTRRAIWPTAARAELVRVPWADGTLVPPPSEPDAALIPTC
ncbi:alcohol dehydrogenase catalytic domain-containing protein [Aeromicrobium sp. UC242_57]|uniref:alcohol dehydrogenase catalytic domain-containing protein n=1 Tax=Aeromicrobium sp. UC242_57 TaxID=3374624 RepID=UPI0037A014FE